MNPELTADEWGLLTMVMDCEVAADAINDAVEDAFLFNDDRDGVYGHIKEVRRDYLEYGAMSAQTERVVSRILDGYFGER